MLFRSKQYLCFDIKKAKSFPKEAREYVNIHGQDFLYARAVIVHSHIQMFMLNSLLKISTPIIPLKGCGGNPHFLGLKGLSKPHCPE